MEKEFHREEVCRILQEAVKRDKCRVNILKVSEFGLVQMTRKRTREDLTRMMCEPCPCCKGDGIVKSRRTLCYEIFRNISLNAGRIPGSKVRIMVSPPVAALMLKEEADTLHRIEEDIKKQINIFPDKNLILEKFEIVWEDD
jgi:ribonuclease G